LKKVKSAESAAEESYNAAKIARLEKEGQVSEQIKYYVLHFTSPPIQLNSKFLLNPSPG